MLFAHRDGHHSFGHQGRRVGGWPCRHPFFGHRAEKEGASHLLGAKCKVWPYF
jgi:hypothetical protein